VRKLPAFPAIASSLAAIAVASVASPARADTSAWMFVGGGAIAWKQTDIMHPVAGTMTIDVGAGSSPEGRFIVGGFFRIQPIFSNGTDIAVLGRVCTHGFQAGDWGVAVDAGGFARAWGNQSIGFSSGFSLGMPLGFTLGLMSEIGTDRAVSFGVVGGIDLLRLTVYRRVLRNWWQNPSPSWTSQKTATSGVSGAPSFHF
jgi:hypothetical protein